ncbi:hypothetical protein E1218_08550 [Kribbella turkmenica]|uniref:Uncharacterized protein n=1 Tax=Kribbella turkmenica TaxID=2530375 RepID=A0A4R4XBN7_9ACTN|nr:hypothetical protein [Kribbella turkmenica]TDD28076.1 hypothetical protein E1218_08550 [Kribbella turkmenica]
MSRRLTKLMATGAISAALLGAVAASGGPASAVGSPTCLYNTKATSFTVSDGPFSGGTDFVWNVVKGCPEVALTFAGSAAKTSGSASRNPVATTEYKLVATVGSSSKVLASGTALAGKVFDYVYSNGRWVKVQGTGTDAAAASAIAGKISSALAEPSKKALLGKVLEVHIIPSSAKLTDLAPWKYLEGTGTCDNKPGCVEDRDWSIVRGIGATVVPGTNQVAMAAASEELVATPGKPSTHKLGHIMAHEFSHVFLQKGFVSDAFRKSVETVLAQRGPSADYVGYDAYTRSSVDEYWAEGSAALFAYSYDAKFDHEYKESWLAANDPALLAKLNAVYPNR